MMDKLGAIAVAAQIFINPNTGLELPPEPQHNGCFCSVHYKNVQAPVEPAKPFRQMYEPPSVDSVPDVLEPVK